MRGLVAKALLALAVFGLGGAWIVGSILVLPRPSQVPPPAPSGRVVHLVASDGVPIAGSYWPGARPDGPAVLLLHGINNTRDRLRQQALWLPDGADRLQTSVIWNDDYRARVGALFARTLGAP